MCCAECDPTQRMQGFQDGEPLCDCYRKRNQSCICMGTCPDGAVHDAAAKRENAALEPAKPNAALQATPRLTAGTMSRISQKYSEKYSEFQAAAV